MTETTTIEAERERMGQLYQRSKRRKKNVIIKQSDKKYFIIHERDWKQFVLAATLCADPTKNNNNNNSTTSNKQPQQQQPKDIKWNLKHICTYTVSRREEKKEVGSIHWVRARTIGISTANRLKYPLKAIWCVFMCVAVSAFFCCFIASKCSCCQCDLGSVVSLSSIQHTAYLSHLVLDKYLIKILSTQMRTLSGDRKVGRERTKAGVW